MSETIQTILNILILAPAFLAGVILLAVIISLACAGADAGRYFINLLIAFDQGVNTLCGGSPDETISAVCYRKGSGTYATARWRLAYRFVNMLFFWQEDHCWGAFESESERNQLHPSYRGGEG